MALRQEESFIQATSKLLQHQHVWTLECCVPSHRERNDVVRDNRRRDGIGRARLCLRQRARGAGHANLWLTRLVRGAAQDPARAQREGLACDLDGIPLLGCFAVGGPRPRRYSRDEFSRAFAECQALALEVARFLVDEVGADVNYEFDHETPLSSTVKRGCEPIAKLLLERGADNRSRVQALFWAADFADDSMLKLLLENGADV
jgi:hypothetical protein